MIRTSDVGLSCNCVSLPTHDRKSDAFGLEDNELANLIGRRNFVGSIAAAVSIATVGGAKSVAAALMTEPIVETRSGRIGGRITGDVRIFTGIPYGSAARFQSPVAPSPWKDVLNATRPPNVAPQPPGYFERSVPQSEDCLYLNIWTPVTPGPHPVMIFIHGGANEGGWCGDAEFAGDSFARSGIVFVGLNYRVGALGFLELSEELGPLYRGSGNNGLKDQILAMRWVNANIAAFGGDARRITLAGNSAGAKNVAAHLARSGSSGLFDRAAMFSGGGQTVHDLKTAQIFARLLTSKLGGRDKLLTAPIASVLDAQINAKALWPSGFPFRPVIDRKFLRDKPENLIGRGSAKGIPLLIGNNSHESRLFVSAERAAGPLQVQDLANQKLAPMEILDRLYAQAFPMLTVAERHWQLLTDEEYAIPSLRLAEKHAGTGSDVYRYILNHPAPDGPFKGLVPHAMELPLVFGRSGGGYFGLSANDQPVADMVHRTIAAFVAKGVPSASNLPRWPRFSKRKRLTMIIAAHSHVRADPERATRKIWNELDLTDAGTKEPASWHSQLAV